MGNFSSKPVTGPSPSATEGHSQDTVIPFRYFDNQAFLRQFTLVFTYRFDAVLDPEKLKNALERLTEIGNWREIGARVRKDASGGLEYHPPQSFSTERPAFSWSEVKLDLPIRDYQSVNGFPHAVPDDSGPQFFEDGAALSPLVEADDSPRKTEDWTETDAPLLTFHVVCFRDATIVTVSWCHAFFDGVALASLMHAWTAVLAGREDRVPPLLSFKQDPVELLHSHSKAAPESYVLHRWALSGLFFAKFAFNQVWEMLWYSKVQTRVICLPGAFVDRLKEEALASIAVSSRTSDARDQKEFVSSADVITAFLARTTVAALALPASTPIALAPVLDARGLLPADILPDGAAYMGNMCIQFLTYPTAGELANESLGATALRVRKALNEQRTPEQFEAYIATHKQATAEKRLPLFGPSGMVMINVSSWQKAGFCEFDFSPAVVPSAASGEGGALGSRAVENGKPAYISPSGHENVPMPSRNVGCIVGKDGRGDWWMNWTIRREAWGAFERVAREAAAAGRE